MAADRLKGLLENAAGADRFSMSILAKDAAALLADAPIATRLADIRAHLHSERLSDYIFESLLRNTFLIELVKTPKIETTKTEVRWIDRLGPDDPRYAPFATCYAIFDDLVAELATVIHDERSRNLLDLFRSNRLIAYELPLDYARREVDAPIHVPGNVIWLWDELPKRVVELRAFLTAPETNEYASMFTAAYDQKIQVKTYLTDRVLTGKHKTNREKRWEAHPGSVHFALRRACMGVEYELIGQLCRFEGFPPQLKSQLESLGLLLPGETPFKCPITQDVLGFDDFVRELERPIHGKSSFHVGHLNPLKAINEDVNAGHTAANISWISADGNRIQGHLTLAETRTMLGRIVENYAELDLPLGTVRPSVAKPDIH